MKRAFLTAEWRHLLMLNYEVEPGMLATHIPPGVGLDLYEGRALVSLVGFRFLKTRVLGIPIPFHRNFDELNLRFYVVRDVRGQPPRRGVCFIREFVPRFAIAFVARTLYQEPYTAVPMRHDLRLDATEMSVSYAVKLRATWHTIAGIPVGAPSLATDNPEIAFITEHYWGYTDRGAGRTSEYEVVHPVWQARRVVEAHFEGNAASVYGPKWGETLSGPPDSAFLAAGSPIAVMQGHDI